MIDDFVHTGSHSAQCKGSPQELTVDGRHHIHRTVGAAGRVVAGVQFAETPRRQESRVYQVHRLVLAH